MAVSEYWNLKKEGHNIETISCMGLKCSVLRRLFMWGSRRVDTEGPDHLLPYGKCKAVDFLKITALDPLVNHKAAHYPASVLCWGIISLLKWFFTGSHWLLSILFLRNTGTDSLPQCKN